MVGVGRPAHPAQAQVLARRGVRRGGWAGPAGRGSGRAVSAWRVRPFAAVRVEDTYTSTLAFSATYRLPRTCTTRTAPVARDGGKPMAVDYAVIVVYLAGMLAMGWSGMRRAKSKSEFLVAGRRLGPWMYSGTMAAIVLGGASTIGGVGLGYQYGLSGAWMVLTIGLAASLSVCFPRRFPGGLRRAGRRTVSRGHLDHRVRHHLRRPLRREPHVAIVLRRCHRRRVLDAAEDVVDHAHRHGPVRRQDHRGAAAPPAVAVVKAGGFSEMKAQLPTVLAAASAARRSSRTSSSTPRHAHRAGPGSGSSPPARPHGHGGAGGRPFPRVRHRRSRHGTRPR
ncbi:hypothetical protein SMICM304S_09631 [Streptomyces microflavus]